MPSRKHILILDLLPKSEPSEGALLKKFFDLCRLYKPARAQSLFFKVRGKNDFLDKLDSGTRYDIIHIAAHGDKDRKGVFIGNGRSWSVTPEEIAGTDHRATLIFANACVGSRARLAEAFHGARYYIAPRGFVDAMNATVFALLFYKRYIVDGVSFQSSFEYAGRRTGTGSDFPFYWEKLDYK